MLQSKNIIGCCEPPPRSRRKIVVGLLLSAVRAGRQHRAKAVLGRFCSGVAAGIPPWSCRNRTEHPNKKHGLQDSLLLHRCHPYSYMHPTYTWGCAFICRTLVYPMIQIFRVLTAVASCTLSFRYQNVVKMQGLPREINPLLHYKLLRWAICAMCCFCQRPPSLRSGTPENEISGTYWLSTWIFQFNTKLFCMFSMSS